jgi:hypothetical protein
MALVGEAAALRNVADGLFGLQQQYGRTLHPQSSDVIPHCATMHLMELPS